MNKVYIYIYMNILVGPGWKKIHPVYEMLTPLDIMEAQLRASLKTPSTIVPRCSRSCRGPKLGPHDDEILKAL